MGKSAGQKKKFVILNGSRFEVTPEGLLYCPADSSGNKKHKCPDCHFCQWCAESRCNTCRGTKKS